VDDSIDAGGSESVQPNSAEALLAGTLALMTGHAEATDAGERRLMAQRISGNLLQLAEHPLLSPHFRMALSALMAHWEALLAHGPEGESAAEGRWVWYPACPSRN
jgi:hypothetical protein